MKKVLLVVAIALAGFGLQAQKALDKTKDLLEKKKFADAKTEIDNYLAVEKNQNSSEAWYLKGKVYAAMSLDSTQRATSLASRDAAFESLKKYIALEKTKDSAKRHLALLMDNNGPVVDVYRGYSADGASYYNSNNFNDAYTSFAKTLDVFDFISANKLLPVSFDTTTILYAGISAEKANKPDNAATYYGMIAEKKINSDGFVEIYKWLADYYGKKGDMTNAAKFTQLGREVFPKDQFWDAYDLDIVREKGTKEELFKRYEQVIANNPTNHLFVYNYAVELYQLGYNQDIKQRPANSKELISKSAEQLKKVIELKPDYPNAHLVLGQLYYNEGVDIINVNKEIRPPSGGKLKPDELKKKDELRKETAAKFDLALPYFEKVDQILGSQGKLKMEDKTNLKDTYDLIIMIYENRQNKEKAEEYTVKFNEVDKKH
ncbi:MAG: tetratricopeptide repeat protein [Chitinophagaceae bacterium]|nr:tetratricopeptide repeat protein [Chitinophagaceae bacterium]